MIIRPSYGETPRVVAWKSLVHVCRRWRNIIFGSPRRLNLQLICTPKTPAKDTLNAWPALPLLVWGNMTSSNTDMDNVIAALGQSNRVREAILLNLTGRQLEEALAAMHVPFPELTDLRLSSNDETPPVIPDSFLDGSASRLRIFELDGIPFPGVANLLLSANHLLCLRLFNIPHSGYISPAEMVDLLSVLSSLKKLSLEFRSPQSRPDRETRRLHPLKRSILPALGELYFKGVNEYLEELVTHIDTPQLGHMHITLFNQIDFDYPRLAQFINCTPRLGARDEAHVQFDDSTASVTLRYRTTKSCPDDLHMEISCREPDWQVSSVAQLCNSSLHPLSTVEDLYIEHEYSRLVWKNDAIENTLWLEILLPFTAVKNLYLPKEFAQGIATALKELVGARITEVLPSLKIIFVEGLQVEQWGPLQENIGQFTAARWRSDHPITISLWDRGRK